MAEKKPDSENPGASVRKYPPFPTTAEAEVAKGTGEVGTYTVKGRAPKTTLLVLSWGVFSMESNSSSDFRSEKTSSSRLHQGPTVRCSWVDGWPA